MEIKDSYGNPIPRRAFIERMTPAERAIYETIGVVEQAGCHPLLTDAVILLSQAQRKVADFVDQSEEKGGENNTMEERIPKTGDTVIYCDTKGVDHHALITVAWGATPTGCVNLLWVSGDESKTDQYGRQIERQSSCVHKTSQGAHGNYWRWPEEEPNAYTPPAG